MLSVLNGSLSLSLRTKKPTRYREHSDKPALEECEGLLEFEMQYHNSHGRIVLNAEAAEVCAKCEGEGKIAAMNGGLVICDACGGRLGSISNLTTLRPNGTEFLLIRRGDFSGPLSPRRAA